MTIGAPFGLPIIHSKLLPMPPSPGEDARRLVRHGYADVLAWLGEDVGPEPGEPTHGILTETHVLASAEWITNARRELIR